MTSTIGTTTAATSSIVDVSSLVDVVFSRVRNVAGVRGDDTVISGVFVVVTLGAGLERKL